MRIETQVETVSTPAPQSVVVRRRWQAYLLTFLMVFGPGLIVMEADNDAGAVSTYMQAGGQYGLHLLWLLVVLLPMCYFVQETVARLGIATGKGHAAMIYERFGKWWGRFSLIDLLAVNFLTLITEFAVISLALSALGISPYVSVPVSDDCAPSRHPSVRTGAAGCRSKSGPHPGRDPHWAIAELKME